jgi:hypothetical protein
MRNDKWHLVRINVYQLNWASRQVIQWFFRGVSRDFGGHFWRSKLLHFPMRPPMDNRKVHSARPGPIQPAAANPL